MNWEEIRTRLGQRVSKHLDLAMYRTGLVSPAPRLVPRPDVQARFFIGDKDEAAHRALLVRTHLPQEAAQIIQEADEICRHGFHLLGCEKLEYGPSIDWHADPVHGRRSPLKPWFKINFLDFSEVGDHKIIWELNRHQHLVTLGKAWCLTHNQTYSTELVDQWYSWQKHNPYPLGINWASALEVAMRSLSWLWVRSLFAGCPYLPANFQTEILLALQQHGRYIERYLSTYFSPNTHLLGEAVALFFIGLSCPEISAAERWRDIGWRIVLQESKRQVRSDGLHFEQALYYHVYALDFFLHARFLASQNGFAIPEQFDDVLKRMLDVVQGLSEVGPIEGFGDDDGGRVFNPRRNRVDCMTDPLAVGAVMYGLEQYTAARLTEEAIWLFGDRALDLPGEAHPKPPSASRAFEAGGIYLINEYEPCSQQLMIDGGPQGTGRAGHGHADALSIRFSVDGHRVLVDPGTCCYVCDGNDRNSFRGTGAHNTLSIDHLHQATPAGPFAWDSIPNVRAETWLNGQTFDFFVGSHDGYSGLPDPVLHRRSVFHVKAGLWLVRDMAEGEGPHLLESFWHFGAEVDVRDERGIIIAQPSDIEEVGGRACMGLLVDRNSVWTTEIVKGFVSPAYGSKQVASVLKITANAHLPVDCGVLLLPNVRLSDIGLFSTLGDSSAPGVRGYCYQALQTTEFLFFAQGNDPWTNGVWTSDAELLYCKLERGRCTHVIMVSGSFAEWRGKRFISQPSVAETFEWISRSGSVNPAPLGDNLLKNSVLTDFEVFDSAF